MKPGLGTTRFHRWLVLGFSLFAAGSFSLLNGVHGAEVRADPAALEQLIETLSEAKDPEARRRAAEGLGTLGNGSARAAPALVQALAWDAHPAVRGRVAEALGLIGPVTEEVVPALIEALEWDDQLRVRWRAAEALERLGPVTGDVVPALIEALAHDKYRGVRARAAQALGTIGPETEHVVPALIRALRHDRQAGVRWQAAAALEKSALKFRDAKATTTIAVLKEALAALEAHDEPDIQSNANAVREAIWFLQSEGVSQPTQ